MQALNVKKIGTDVLRDDSGTAGFDWISIGMAAQLFIAMTGLEAMVYACTGRGFLQP